jgi:hypothetical protein
MEYVKNLCEDLKLVYKRILQRNTWLQPSTKKYALEKLKHFNFIYGKPNNLREDPDLNYGTLLYDNMKKINDWRHRKFVDLEGKGIIDIPMMDWNLYPVKMVGTQAYIVNASYSATNNSVYINLGFIQKPFVDLDERGIEYNLAHIGYTIGHEFSHAFDDWGSNYGWDGNLNDWWTDADKKKYEDYIASLNEDEKKLVAQGKNFYVINFKNKGGLPMPVIIKLNYEDGTEEVLRFPAEVWRLNDVEAKKIIPTSKKVVKWTLDPYYEIADIDTDDNAFPREPAKPTKVQLFKEQKRSYSLDRNPMQDAKKAKEASGAVTGSKN